MNVIEQSRIPEERVTEFKIPMHMEGTLLEFPVVDPEHAVALRELFTYQGAITLYFAPDKEHQFNQRVRIRTSKSQWIDGMGHVPHHATYRYIVNNQYSKEKWVYSGSYDIKFGETTVMRLAHEDYTRITPLDVTRPIYARLDPGITANISIQTPGGQKTFIVRDFSHWETPHYHRILPHANIEEHNQEMRINPGDTFPWVEDGRTIFIARLLTPTPRVSR